MPATSSRWLILIHQIPPRPNYLRVKVGRHLQRLGAVALKNSVYVLPNEERSTESFEWLTREIQGLGGDATVCASDFVGGQSDGAVEALFNDDRRADYEAIAAEAREARKRLGRKRRLDETARGEVDVILRRLRGKLGEVVARDFFGAEGRDAATALLDELETLARPDPQAGPTPPGKLRLADHSGLTWVTRKGVHVDRMASAWLIRRFIDPKARFKFVAPKGYQPQQGERRFDMFDAEFTHDGDACTFEVLLRRFDLGDPALADIAKIVHEIDIRDGKFERAETSGIERVVTGLALIHRDDDDRLAASAALFEALYETWSRKRT